ncbi:transcription factor [Pelomyxa schiedti]|nr:transcription factor [Pelomyxa schiedti]
MCKHILNAQVSVRAACCKKWFDCPECHNEQSPDHPLMKSFEIVLACKKCRKVFRKDVRDFDETDEFCPHCDNHYVLPAKTPERKLVVELEGSLDMVRDDRTKSKSSVRREDD